MAFRIDKSRLSSSFSKAAPTYDAFAAPQRAIADRLAALLPDFTPGRILDVGCGTGYLTNLLHQRFPSAAIRAIDIAPGMTDFCRQKYADSDLVRFETADAETFAADEPFDLVVSSSALQWLRDPAPFVTACPRNFSPGGRIALAVPVAGTLGELRQSFTAATGSAMPAVGFREAAHYTDRLAGAGFVPALSLIERFEVTYEDPWRLLESLKGIGAGLSGQPGFSPLAAASLKKLMEYYAANFKMDKGVRATYRVLYYLSEPTT